MSQAKSTGPLLQRHSLNLLRVEKRLQINLVEKYLTVFEISEPTQNSKKAVLRGYRQKLMTIKARIRYLEHALKTFRKHLKNVRFHRE